MNREIEFRAWHLDGIGIHTMHEWDQVKHSFNEYLLDSKVMQYTGLKDKNGVKIFEGDIINYGIFALNDTEKYGERAWLNLPEGVNREDISTVRSVHRVDYFIPSLMAIKQAIESNPDVYGVEVIGNIYENPELLRRVEGE